MPIASVDLPACGKREDDVAVTELDGYRFEPQRSAHYLALQWRELVSKSASHAAVPVSFRKIVPELAVRDRATHFLHPYPGKLLSHIPYFFLRALPLPVGAVILDPFCGSGTTLVEAAAAGFSSVGMDVNPFAATLARVKTTVVDEDAVALAAKRAVSSSVDCDVYRPVLHNPDLWYSASKLRDLGRLRTAIARERNAKVRDVLLVVLSLTARKCSFADPRIPVPVSVVNARPRRKSTRIRNAQLVGLVRSINVREEFLRQTENTVVRLRKLRALVSAGTTATVYEDSILSQQRIPDRSIDLVITSPPYCGAQKYVRAVSHSMGWIGLLEGVTTADLEARTIGRERVRRSEFRAGRSSTAMPSDLEQQLRIRNPAKAEAAATYADELANAIRKTMCLVRVGGYFVLVVGNNKVAGIEFPTSYVAISEATRSGGELVVELADNIPSRMLMTKRNARDENVLSQERVIVMQKVRHVE